MRGFGPARELADERSLARARLAEDKCHLTLASQRAIEEANQLGQLGSRATNLCSATEHLP